MKNQKMTGRHFGFTERVYGLPCTDRTLLWKCNHRNAIVHISFFLLGAIAVEARRRWAATAYINIIYITVCMYVGGGTHVIIIT